MAAYLIQVKDHLDKLISAAAQIGKGAMWPSAVDTRTGRQRQEDHIPRRVYRLSGAPRGSTLYWDQPLIVAAYGLSDWTGEKQYAQAVDRYMDAFLSSCVADNGMFPGYPNSHVYESVDGVGFLLLALMFLEGRREIAMPGFGF